MATMSSTEITPATPPVSHTHPSKKPAQPVAWATAATVTPVQTALDLPVKKATTTPATASSKASPKRTSSKPPPGPPSSTKKPDQTSRNGRDKSTQQQKSSSAASIKTSRVKSSSKALSLADPPAGKGKGAKGAGPKASPQPRVPNLDLAYPDGAECGGEEEKERERKCKQYVDDLIEACRAKDHRALKKILDHVKTEERTHILNLKYRDETTPLHEACCYGDEKSSNEKCVSLLLDYGADANVHDVRGFAPIHCAAANNHMSAIEALLNFEPRNKDLTQKCDPNQKSEHKATPLHVACLVGNWQTADFLLKEEADVCIEDSEGNTVVHCVSASDCGMMWAWVKKNLIPQHEGLLSKPNKHGQTPAHKAASLGCTMSVSALVTLCARNSFDKKDSDGYTAIDVMHQRGNIMCFRYASGQTVPVLPIPELSRINRELLTHSRTFSFDSSSSSPKLARRSSMTSQKRPLTVNLSKPPPTSTPLAQGIKRRSSNISLRSNSSQRSLHHRSGSMDSYLSVSGESVAKMSSQLSRLSSVNSEEAIQAIIDNTAYNPPLDLHVVDPVYRQSITPTESMIYCKEHEIYFKSKYFSNNNSGGMSKLRDSFRSRRSSTGVKGQPAVKKSEEPMEESVPVCIAAAMHLNIACPQDVVIISPICFISCRSRRPCRATVQIPHAAFISGNKKDVCILTYTTVNLVGYYASPVVESPVEKSFEVEKVESLDVGKQNVSFKITITNPSLYAVGIKCAGGVARPPVPLQCVLYCLYAEYNGQELISYIPVKMFVGLNLPTVFLIIRQEANNSKCKPHEVLFKMSSSSIGLKAALKNSAPSWQLDNTETQQLTYAQIALTEDTDSHSYSHELYPPSQSVHILPGRLASSAPVFFNVQILDSESRQIKRSSFIPFAPLKSTTATPNPSPPPSDTEETDRFLNPDLPIVITRSTPSPPGLSPAPPQSPTGVNSVQGSFDSTTQLSLGEREQPSTLSSSDLSRTPTPGLSSSPLLISSSQRLQRSISAPSKSNSDPSQSAASNSISLQESGAVRNGLHSNGTKTIDIPGVEMKVSVL